MKTIRLSYYLWIPMAVAALALAGWVFAQKPDTPPGRVGVNVQMPAEGPPWEKSFNSLERRLQGLEQVVADLQQGMVKVQADMLRRTGSDDLQQRIQNLERENAEDHQAIWDLYERLQRVEQRSARTEADLNQRIESLSQTNAALQQQLRESQERESQRKNPSGYPFIERTYHDQQGNVIIDYSR